MNGRPPTAVVKRVTRPVYAVVVLSFLAVIGASFAQRSGAQQVVKTNHVPPASQSVAPAVAPVILPQPTYLRSVLSRDGNDTFVLNASSGVVTMAAPPSNTSTNTRQVFWPSGKTPTTDEASCQVWGNEPWLTQPAVALRVAQSGNGVRAITVTKNIWAGATYVINIYLWDTSKVGQSGTLDQAMVDLQGFQLSGLSANGGPTDGSPANSAAFPWEMCAKVVGSQLTFRVWPISRPDPGWGNPAYGGTVTLPAGWTYPGSVGGYVAHLAPGVQASFTPVPFS